MSQNNIWLKPYIFKNHVFLILHTFQNHLYVLKPYMLDEFGNMPYLCLIILFGPVHYVLPGKKKHNFGWFVQVKSGTKNHKKINKIAIKILHWSFLARLKVENVTELNMVMPKIVQE